MRKKAIRSRQRLPTSEAPALASGLWVLVELGAEWPDHLLQAPGPRRVLAQLDGEAPSEFAARAAGFLEDSFGPGLALGGAVIGCNERLDAQAEAARGQLARLALGALASRKSGRVYFTASERSSGRLRQALTGLARGLLDEWSTAGLEVSVRFGEERNTAAAAAAFPLTARVA